MRSMTNTNFSCKAGEGREGQGSSKGSVAERMSVRLPRSDIGPTMNLTGEQLQTASMIDGKMQKLVCDGNDDLTILGEMFDYMPGFKRLMDTSEPGTMDELCRRFAGFFATQKSLKWWQPAFSQVRLKSPSKSVIIFHVNSGR